MTDMMDGWVLSRESSEAGSLSVSHECSTTVSCAEKIYNLEDVLII